MRRFNWHAAPLGRGRERPAGFDCREASIGAAIGAERLGGSLLAIPPGERSWPYHWEAGREEWAIVIAGRPTVRHPDGEDDLRPGDVVCFPTGPGGAHQLINRGEDEVRVILLSDQAWPNPIVYPDSAKLGFRIDAETRLLLRLDSATDEYWEGETE